MKEKKMKSNSTGMLRYNIEGLSDKFEIASKGYEFGWMDSARVHRVIKAKTQEQLKLLYNETLENKNKSFDSLYTILEFLLSNRSPNINVEKIGDETIVIDYNRKVLERIFGGTINGYKVLDHIMDRAYKNC